MEASRLLIVEDDTHLAAAIADALSSSSLIIETAHTGTTGLEKARAQKPDLLLLDLGLPELHGLAVLKALQVECPQCRVCIMTAEDELEVKLSAFAAGSDDYLVKPFAFPELQARVKALLKRSKQTTAPTLVFGDTCIYRGAPLVQRAGKRVQLTPMEHRLLVYLAERPGEVVSRSELLDEVWHTADRYPNTVDVHIESLRKKIDIPFGRKSIRTAYRQGYFFEA
ncbi:MAG TPA: response regulator transcription factor [Verrucomicrobiae bacterium]|nr:response regulator transcription factor [Verrucomicrobiae bacterium]